MRASRGGMLAVLGLAAMLVTLAACGGNQAYAPSLDKPIDVTLTGSGAGQPSGSATFTPTYGAHFIVYVGGKEIPYHAPSTPVQLRKGSCTGPVIGALSDNAPVPTGSTTVQVRAAGDHGADAAIAPDTDTYVVVLREAGNPNAVQYACGNPLSTQRQYFELWPAGQSETVGLGEVLSEALVATKLEVTLDTPAAAQTAWAVRVGNCSGKQVADGTFATGATTANGFMFEQLVPGQWWLAVGPSGQTGNCVKVG